VLWACSVRHQLGSARTAPAHDRCAGARGGVPVSVVPGCAFRVTTWCRTSTSTI